MRRTGAGLDVAKEVSRVAGGRYRRAGGIGRDYVHLVAAASANLLPVCGSGAQEWLSGQSDVDPARIAYFGESLGAAVAVGLAVQRPPAALVLRSPFTSLAEVGAVHYPWLPLRRLLLDHYPSIERIASVHAPVLVIAGGSDDIVPATLSERLVAAAAEPKRYVVVPGVGHNDPELLDGRVMLDAIRRFLTETAVLGQ